MKLLLWDDLIAVQNRKKDVEWDGLCLSIDTPGLKSLEHSATLSMWFPFSTTYFFIAVLLLHIILTLGCEGDSTWVARSVTAEHNPRWKKCCTSFHSCGAKTGAAKNENGRATIIRISFVQLQRGPPKGTESGLRGQTCTRTLPGNKIRKDFGKMWENTGVASEHS